MITRKLCDTILFLFCFSLCLCATDVADTSFTLSLNNTQPDYFKFIDENGKEIDSDGITFSFPDLSTLVSTANVRIKYNIYSGATLTLHSSSGREWADSESGYMLVGEENEEFGLNYSISVTAASEGIMLLNLPELPEENINTTINLRNYDIVIYSTSNGNPKSGVIDLSLIINPPKNEDGDPYYMDDIYSGFLTMSLTSQ